MSATKGIAVLGSTGSIGSNALDIIERFPEKFHVVSFSAGKNLAKLREQIRKFRPQIVSVLEAGAAAELQSEFPEVRILFGDEGLDACTVAPGADVW